MTKLLAVNLNQYDNNSASDLVLPYGSIQNGTNRWAKRQSKMRFLLEKKMPA